jgi:hypothetical protein
MKFLKNMNNMDNKENKCEVLEVITKDYKDQYTLSMEDSMINGFFNNLKEGDPVFIYTKDLFQVTIFSNFELIDGNWIPNPTDFSVSIITEKDMLAIKHANMKYLKNQVYNFMKEANVEKTILEDYKLILKNMEIKPESKSKEE